MQKYTRSREGSSTTVKLMAFPIFMQDDWERVDINITCRNYDEYRGLAVNLERAIVFGFQTLFNQDRRYTKARGYVEIPKKSLGLLDHC